MTRDQQLLLGIFAVQYTDLTSSDLQSMAAEWTTDPSTSLWHRIRQREEVSDQDAKFVEQAAKRLVAAHKGDVAAALEAVGGADTVHRTFGGAASIEEEDSLLASIGGGSEMTNGGGREVTQLGRTADITVAHPGRYEIKDEIGRGGMGRVLEAFDKHIGRDIAIKELLIDQRRSTSGQKADLSPAHYSLLIRFLREARITAQLQHPSIVPVHEIARDADGKLFYAMKLIRGKTLADALAECENLGDRLELLGHFKNTCQAIAYAHSRGVIHRDLKPQNIMVGEFGETLVVDWGLAKADIEGDTEEVKKHLKMFPETARAKTVAGQPLGTPAYMSPEQANGEIDEIDERSDIWSLGVILYEILTGETPFDGVTPIEIVVNVLRSELPSVYDVCPEAPPHLIEACEKALQRDKARRYRSAKDFATDVDELKELTRIHQVINRTPALAGTFHGEVGDAWDGEDTALARIHRGRALPVPPAEKPKTKAVAIGFGATTAILAAAVVVLAVDPFSEPLENDGIFDAEVVAATRTTDAEAAVGDSEPAYEEFAASDEAGTTEAQVAEQIAEGGTIMEAHDGPVPPASAPPTTQERAQTTTTRSGSCSGSSSRLSVMAIGAKGCKVTVGKKRLGDAPFFKKDAPSGRCTVKVVCAEGKKYSTVMDLKAGGSEKLIVKGPDWASGGGFKSAVASQPTGRLGVALEEAVRLVSNGKLRDAHALLQKHTGSREAMVLARKIDKFDKAYQSALIDHRARKTDSAIKKLNQARAYEAKITGGGTRMSAEVRRKLADMHFIDGFNALKKRDKATAMRNFNKALSVYPNHGPTMKKIHLAK